MAYRRASLMDLYLHTIEISLKSEELFLDGLSAVTPYVQGHVTQKLGQISKIRPDQI